MKSLLDWLTWGIFLVFGLAMICLGLLFVKNIVVSLSLMRGQATFSCLILAIILLFIGGGLLRSAISRSGKRASVR